MGKRLIISGADFSENALTQEDNISEMTLKNVLNNSGFYEPMRDLNAEKQITATDGKYSTWWSWWIDLSKFGGNLKFWGHGNNYSVLLFDDLDNPRGGEIYTMVSGDIFKHNSSNILIVNTERKYLGLNMLGTMTEGYDLQTAYEMGEVTDSMILGTEFIQYTNVF